MDTATSHNSSVTSLEGKVHSLWLVAAAAIAAGLLRFALWAANVITLWYLYGWATVNHDHLKIVRVKPDLVVSNGDVLHGIGGYHYFVGVAVWLPLGIGLVFVVYRFVLPKVCQSILRKKDGRDKSSGIAVLYVLLMFILVTAFLPTVVALTLAFISAAVPVIWIRAICSTATLR